MKIGAGCQAFVDAMRQRGILIRDMSGSPGCEGCVRITIGRREEMERLTNVMRETVRSLAADLGGSQGDQG